MDKLSYLIKEAKPLYLKKKIRHERSRKVFVALAFVGILCFSVYVSFMMGTNVAKENNQIDIKTSNTIYPIDDYGLVSVE